MIKDETAVGRFLEVYARESNGDDIAAIVLHFSDPFFFAGARGTQCVRASDFAAALVKRREMFKRLGARPSSLMSVEERELDARYVLAKTRWRIEFVRENQAATELLLDSTSLIDTGSDPFRIVMYMPHQDIMEEVRRCIDLPSPALHG